MTAPQLLGLLAAAERSSAYSRIVSSIRKRSSPIGFSEALVDERGELVEIRVADLLGRLEREVPAKTARRAKRSCAAASSRS